MREGGKDQGEGRGGKGGGEERQDTCYIMWFNFAHG